MNLTGRLLSSASPAALFANGEVGVWYDPSDLTTLFQDSAGTIPVTAPNQSVGKMLDKSGRGNHATQATSTQRPIYGINPITGTRNLLTYTEQFDNAVWVKANASIVTDAATAPNGTTTAEKLIVSATTGTHTCGQNYTVPISTIYTGSVYVKAGEYNFAAILLLTTFPAAQFIICDLTAGTIITTSGSPLATSITAVGAGWYRISITQTTSAAGTATIQVRPSNSGTTTSFTGDGTSGIYVWGAQLELGTVATAYQKVVSQYEVTQAGVASVSYLAFDGVDDGMVTGTITPSIDKVQVFAGVRKLSDAALGGLIELSPSVNNDGAFALFAPNAASAYDFVVRGTARTDAISPAYTAPITNVVSGLGDIAGASNLIRVNGTQVGSILSTLGTGNFLAYPIYIGRRNAASSPYNGRLYSLIARFGANLTTGQITSTESWVNGKTGAY